MILQDKVMLYLSCLPEHTMWPGHVDESIEQRASLLAALKVFGLNRSL